MTTPHSPSGRIALVTGAASGIGAALARTLAQRGDTVWCADLDRAGADATAAGLGGESPSDGLALDVRREADWERALTALGGRLDIVAHSAGISAAGPVHQTTLEEWRRAMAVNLDGAFLAVRTGIRAMQSGGGSILVIGSASGIRPAAGAAAYSTSKAALRMLVQTAAKECRDAGWRIRINVLSPAGVKTAMWRSMPFFQDLVRQHGPENAAFEALAGTAGRFAEPEDVAEAAAFLVSDAAGFVTGVELPFDGGYVL
jgi:NAD(P)-dependent dehydrogenase (short-subunit alcohol dehydrogenase family)